MAKLRESSSPMTRWLLQQRFAMLAIVGLKKRTNTLITLAGRAADPHRLHPCEVANSVAVFRELSWLTRRMAKVKLDRNCGAEVGPLAKTPHSTGLDLLD